MSPKKLPKNAFFYLFDLQNHTYTSRRATKIGMRMHWDAFSVQLENHENREISRYPKLTRVHSTYPQPIWSLLEPVKVVLHHFKNKMAMPKLQFTFYTG